MAENHHHSSRSCTDDDLSSIEQQRIRDDGVPIQPLEKQSTATSGLSALERRATSALSTIRSREPGQTARFTHPLTHTKTTEDVLVDFDGPDDPYKPLNWAFRKKAITTLLYGLTTMGTYCSLGSVAYNG